MSAIGGCSDCGGGGAEEMMKILEMLNQQNVEMAANGIGAGSGAEGLGAIDGSAGGGGGSPASTAAINGIGGNLDVQG